jgi:hypothetical protein
MVLLVSDIDAVLLKIAILAVPSVPVAQSSSSWGVLSKSSVDGEVGEAMVSKSSVDGGVGGALVSKSSEDGGVRGALVFKSADGEVGGAVLVNFTDGKAVEAED